MAEKRLPFTGAYNTRSSSVNALTSSSGVVGVGIVGNMIVGNASRSSDKDVRYINCLQITEPDEISQTKKLYVVKRPGFVTHTTPASGEKGVAIKIWVANSAKVMTAFGITNSTIYDGTTSKGAITGRCSGITETSISEVPTLAISSLDNTGWYLASGGSLTKIASANFPGNASRTLAGTFAHLNGRPYIMDSHCRVYNGDLNSLTAWTENSYFTANNVPDEGVCVVRHRYMLVAFGKKHFEVLRDSNATSLSPLSREEHLCKQIGCVSADAIASISDTIFWAGPSDQGVISIYAYDGGEPIPVSNSSVEAQLTIAGAANITLTAMSFYGRHVVVVKASNTTYVYCIEEKNWHEWSSSVPLWTKSDGVTTGSTMVCYSISDVSTAGKVFVFNPASVAYQDNGVNFTATIQTSRLDFGTNKRKRWGPIHVVGDTEDSASPLGISYSDSDYRTSGPVRYVDLSQPIRKIDKTGVSQRRSFTLTHSANTPMRLEALEFPEFEVLTK